MIRFGEISFINALPLALPGLEIDGLSVQTISQSPAQLNQGILEGRLDISPVSSAFYLRHQSELVMLPEICIQAKHTVESVLLFLPQGWDGLIASSVIAIPDTSETSIALMQYLLYQKAAVRCPGKLQIYPPGEGRQALEKGIPALAIGDEALRLKAMADTHGRWEVVDLAQSWRSLTGLPFVFALWVARRNWAQENTDALQKLQSALVQQYHLFLTNPVLQNQVIEEAYQRCPDLSRTFLRHYYTEALSYTLDEHGLLALSSFDAILRWLDDEYQYSGNRDCPQLPLELLHRSGR